jgi:hypothetical protein
MDFQSDDGLELGVSGDGFLDGGGHGSNDYSGSLHVAGQPRRLSLRGLRTINHEGH